MSERDPSGGIRAEGSEQRIQVKGSERMDLSGGIRVEGSERLDPSTGIQVEGSERMDMRGRVPSERIRMNGSVLIYVVYHLSRTRTLRANSGIQRIYQDRCGWIQADGSDSEFRSPSRMIRVE